MTEQKRKLGIRERSCGLLSPLYKDHYRQLSSKRTSLRGVGKFGLPSLSWINTIIKARQMSKPKNHKGIGVGLTCGFGNAPSSWACPPFAPPQIVEIKRGTGVWAT